MADRQIPEDIATTKPPGFKPKSTGQRAIPEANNARNQALKKRILTPHQEHVAHVQHMANVKNNPSKYS